MCVGNMFDAEGREVNPASLVRGRHLKEYLDQWEKGGGGGRIAWKKFHQRQPFGGNWFIKHLLFAKHLIKYFTMLSLISLPPFYRQENWGPERGNRVSWVILDMSTIIFLHVWRMRKRMKEKWNCTGLLCWNLFFSCKISQKKRFLLNSKKWNYWVDIGDYLWGMCRV